MSRNSLPVDKMPTTGRPVKALIKHWQKWTFEEIELVAVDEGDCDWRIKDGNEELSLNWNVVYWEYSGRGE